jgi:hypothetical protein
MTRPSLLFRLLLGPLHKAPAWPLMVGDNPFVFDRLNLVVKMSGGLLGMFVLEWLAVFALPRTDGTPNWWLAICSPLLIAGVFWMRHVALRVHRAHQHRFERAHPERITATRLDTLLPPAQSAPSRPRTRL